MAVLYENGTILTMTETMPEVLIEQDGKIVMTGTEAEARQWMNDHPQNRMTVRDLDGMTLMPGLIDGHSHITALAQTVNLVPLEGVDSIAALQDKLRHFMQSRSFPQGRWIQGFGYDHNFMLEKRHPTRHDLDQVSEEIPILIAHASGHMGVVNTAALKLLGIDETQPDPEGGRIGREADSLVPDGYLEETAFTLRTQAIPAPDMNQLMDQLDQAQEIYLSYGITTIQDGITKQADWNGLRAMAEQKRLKADIVSYVDLKDHQNLIQDNPDYGKGYRHHLRIGGVKIFLDGSPQGKTAWMSEPYRGEDPEYCGYPVYSDEQVSAFIETALKNHWQLLTHCNGDAAAQQLLNCYENQMEKHPEAKDLRPVMIHAQLVRHDQLKRMAGLGMVVSFFTAHCRYWGDIHLENFGKERADKISPMRWALDEGVWTTMHQDTPVILPNMMESVQCACQRMTRDGKLLDQGQCLSPLEALKTITVNAARQYHEEADKGTLEVGKMADMIILSENPLTCPVDRIEQIQVMETIKEGMTVYRR